MSAPLTDEEHDLIDLMDSLDGRERLVAEHNMGDIFPDEPLDVAVGWARLNGWDDVSGRRVLDALAVVPLGALWDVYRFDPAALREWAPLDVAVYAWRAGLVS